MAFVKSLMFVAIAALLTSCTIRFNAKYTGDTDSITKTYDLADFNSIMIAGGGEVIFTQDSVYSVKVEAPEEMLAELDLNVQGNTLLVGRNSKNDDKHFFIHVNGSDYKVYVSAPSLTQLSIGGSGMFECKQLTTDEMDISVAGSGNVDIDHLETAAVTTSIKGSGNIELEVLNSQQSVFSISGSGNIEADLHNCGDVTAEISGAGNINLEGDAKSLQQHIAGAGNIDAGGLKIAGK